MTYRIFTLIDITETMRNNGNPCLEVNQQANFNTVMQTIGLRANPTPRSLKQHFGGVGNMTFGAEYKGRHNYWELVFDIEYGETDIDTLKSDFNMVPIITNLNETVKINTSVFNTADPLYTNIIFECLS